MKCIKITTILLIVIFLNSEPSFAPNLSKYQLEQKQSNMRRMIRLNELMSASFSPENLMELIVLLDMPSPEIIFKQAKLETGWFRSNLFKNHNSIFGMHYPRVRDSYSHEYTIADNGRRVASYRSWQSSVLDMKLFIQYYEGLGYDPVNYYKFLVNVGYCEKDIYTNILKNMT